MYYPPRCLKSTTAHESSAENHQTHCHLRSTLVTDYLLPSPLSTPFYNSRRKSTPPPLAIYVTFLVGDLIIFKVHRHDLHVFITFQQHHWDGVVASGSRHRSHSALGGRKLNASGMPLYRRTLQCDTDLNGYARQCSQGALCPPPLLALHDCEWQGKALGEGEDEEGCPPRISFTNSVVPPRREAPRLPPLPTTQSRPSK